jgi:hypothetical protein
MVQPPVFNGSNFNQYIAQMAIYRNQLNQETENKKIHDDYEGAVKNYLVQYESQSAAKQPLPAIPQLPVMNVYNDDGTVGHTPFPDLTQVVPPAAGTPSGPVANQNPPMDRTDAILFLVQEIWNKVNK